jgi:hypothetical protein
MLLLRVRMTHTAAAAVNVSHVRYGKTQTQCVALAEVDAVAVFPDSGSI